MGSATQGTRLGGLSMWGGMVRRAILPLLTSLVITLAGFGGLAAPALAAECAGPLVEPEFFAGNPASLGYRIESPRGAGVFTVTLGDVEYQIGYEVYDGNTLLRFWVTGGAPIVSQVVVKASDAHIYTYDPAVAADCGLRAPDNPGGQVPAISHIDFAFVEPVLGAIKIDKSTIGSDDRSGFEFTLAYFDHGDWQQVATPQTTDQTGVVRWQGLRPGEYRITETAREGWMFTVPDDGAVEVSLAPGQTLVVPFVDTKLGRICVQKDVVGREDLAGFEFTLGYVSGETWEMVPPVQTTDASGLVCWEDLKPGEYRITETARSGWISTTPAGGMTTVTLEPGESLTVPFTNAQLGSITVRKLDQGSAELVGATFELWQGTTRLDTRMLTDVASHTWSDLAPGSYTVVETAPPPGYRLAEPASQAVDLDAANLTVTVDFHNQPVEPALGSITVRKYDAGTQGLSGATFELWWDATLVERITLASATHTWSDLAAGYYTVVETAPPNGYRLADPAQQSMTLTEAEGMVSHVTVDFHNQPIETERGSITVRKYGEGGQSLTGARFALWQGDAKVDERTLAGSSYTWTNLVPGSYTVVEVAAPSGWLRATPSSQQVTLALGEGSSMDVFVDFVNRRERTPELGSLRVVKYTDQGEPLAGARFALYRGDVKLEERTLSGSSTTWHDLAAGVYRVVEVAAPPGWIRRTESQSITLSAGEDALIAFCNDPVALGSITVVKLSTSDEPLSGATFALYQGTAKLDERRLTGNSHTWANLAAGTYTVVEVGAPDGHRKANPDRITVTLTAGATTVTSQTVTFRNPPAPGSVTVVKLVYNPADGSIGPLNGATFALYRPDQAGVLVDQRTLAGNEHTWTDLAPGDYTVVEVAVPNRPDGTVFELATPVSVSVPAGQNVRVEIFNELPLTGTSQVPPLVAGLLLVGAGLTLRRRRTDPVRVQPSLEVAVRAVHDGNWIVASDAIFGHQNRRRHPLAKAMLKKQRVMPHTKAHHNIEIAALGGE